MIPLIVLAIILSLSFVAWRRYLWASQTPPGQEDNCPYSLSESFSEQHLANVPHQRGVRWLNEVFSRSARAHPNLPALQIPHNGTCLSFAELDTRADAFAAALAPYLSGPDQVVAVALQQDSWQIIAAHLGILRAGAAQVVKTALVTLQVIPVDIGDQRHDRLQQQE